ncbi:MAG: hypothetical protein KA354_02150 [Phycisphaerae bacterium]|nr:hypothetical protein [Phycisphaerae bacterium]
MTHEPHLCPKLDGTSPRPLCGPDASPVSCPPPGRRFARSRDWICPLVTLAVAALWTLAAKGAADHVNHSNLARLMGTVMFGTSLSPDSGNETALPFPLPGPKQTRPAPAKPLFHESLARQSGSVEGTTYIWRWSMMAVAVLLTFAAILSLATSQTRPLHLLAALVILASTVGTYLAIRQLVNPARGGLEEQPLLFYVLVLGLQSLYGWVLLFLFAPRPAPRMPAPSQGGHR